MNFADNIALALPPSWIGSHLCRIHQLWTDMQQQERDAFIVLGILICVAGAF